MKVTLTISLCEHSPVTVIGERVSEHFAVAPALALGEDATIGYDEHATVLVHICSGYAIVHGNDATGMRGYADALEQLPIDWTTFTAPTAEQATAIGEACTAVGNAPTEPLPGPARAAHHRAPAAVATALAAAAGAPTNLGH
ncbi:hypothetical protein [Nocardia asiatica]|uniref:hypothetical protein n=1 Tax=Nocardia asiatica TaxID=209252 RepID=UPI0002F0E153|nr:hypothetical protein [Nocardia asiatica]